MARKDASQAHADSPLSTATNRKRRFALAGCGLAVLALAITLRALVGTRLAEAQAPTTAPSEQTPPAAPSPSAALPRRERPQHDVMAVVNGQDIRRDALAAACVERFGEEVLEGLVNKRLILHHCRNRGIVVTDAEIEAEVDRMAARFKIGREQWLGMLEKERGINPEQYKRDILWPTLALRKLAADRLVVSDEQLRKAYEAQFGPAVKCRLIVVGDRALADQLQRQLA